MVLFEVGIENDFDCQLEWFKNGVKVIEDEWFFFVNYGKGGYLFIIWDI